MAKKLKMPKPKEQWADKPVDDQLHCLPHCFVEMKGRSLIFELNDTLSVSASS